MSTVRSRRGEPCTMPVSELVALPIDWSRGKDARLARIAESLARGGAIEQPIRVLVCGCGKSYLLEDGGHRISAAFEHYRRTGEDLQLPVVRLVAEFP